MEDGEYRDAPRALEADAADNGEGLVNLNIGMDKSNLEEEKREMEQGGDQPKTTCRDAKDAMQSAITQLGKILKKIEVEMALAVNAVARAEGAVKIMRDLRGHVQEADNVKNKAVNAVNEIHQTESIIRGILGGIDSIAKTIQDMDDNVMTEDKATRIIKGAKQEIVDVIAQYEAILRVRKEAESTVSEMQVAAKKLQEAQAAAAAAEKSLEIPLPEAVALPPVENAAFAPAFRAAADAVAPIPQVVPASAVALAAAAVVPILVPPSPPVVLPAHEARKLTPAEIQEAKMEAFMKNLGSP